MPPPGTIMCTCGWWVSAEPQVWSTESDADARAEVLGVGCDREQRLGRDLEQEIVDHRLVLIGDVGDGRAGSVNTTWKYGTGSSSASRSASHSLCRRALALRTVPVAAAVVGDGGVRHSSRSARHARRAPPCGSSRSPTSPSAGRGSHGRRWLDAMPAHGRGRYPRPPEPGATRAPRFRRAGRSSRLSFSADMLQRAHRPADRLGGDPRIERRGISSLA